MAQVEADAAQLAEETDAEVEANEEGGASAQHDGAAQDTSPPYLVFSSNYEHPRENALYAVRADRQDPQRISPPSRFSDLGVYSMKYALGGSVLLAETCLEDGSSRRVQAIYREAHFWKLAISRRGRLAFHAVPAISNQRLTTSHGLYELDATAPSGLTKLLSPPDVPMSQARVISKIADRGAVVFQTDAQARLASGVFARALAGTTVTLEQAVEHAVYPTVEPVVSHDGRWLAIRKEQGPKVRLVLAPFVDKLRRRLSGDRPVQLVLNRREELTRDRRVRVVVN